jgi:uncharacterized protein
MSNRDIGKESDNARRSIADARTGRGHRANCMLTRFTVRNFHSIRECQTLRLSSSGDTVHTGAAVIIGPNGSGKSSFLAALALMRDLVLHSNAHVASYLAERYAPFTAGCSSEEPTEFEIELLLDGVSYRYSFSYNGRRICSERLHVAFSGLFQRWFDRSTDTGMSVENWAPFSKNFKGARTMWRECTPPHVLFLSVAGDSSPQLAPLVHWFEDGIQQSLQPEQLPVRDLRTFLFDAQSKAHLRNFLRAAGCGIQDLRLAPLPARSSAPPSVSFSSVALGICHRTGIECSHVRPGAPPVWMRLEEEAMGTQRLIAMFIPLTTALKRRSLFLVDEFDMGLHPLLARYVMGVLTRRATAGAQMILTSHDTTLMDTGVLAPDQIWLMSLGADNASELRQLSQPSTSSRTRATWTRRQVRGLAERCPSFKRSTGEKLPPQPRAPPDPLAGWDFRA